VVLVLVVLGEFLERDSGRALRPVGGFGMCAELMDSFCVGGECGTEEEAWGGDRDVRGLGKGGHCGV
jgi:hypothetical protein